MEINLHVPVEKASGSHYSSVKMREKLILREFSTMNSNSRPAFIKHVHMCTNYVPCTATEAISKVNNMLTTQTNPGVLA